MVLFNSIFIFYVVCVCFIFVNVKLIIWKVISVVYNGGLFWLIFDYWLSMFDGVCYNNVI